MYTIVKSNKTLHQVSVEEKTFHLTDLWHDNVVLRTVLDCIRSNIKTLPFLK